MIYENPCVYIFYLHLTVTGYFSFAAGLTSRCRTARVDNTLWPVEHNLINEYGLGRVGVSSVCLCGDFLCVCRIGQIWTCRSLFMYRYCYTIPVHEMFIETAKQWSMTVRLPSVSINRWYKMSFYTQRNICYTWLEILCLYCTALWSYLFVLATALLRVGERRGVYGVLVGKLEWKRPLGRRRRRWEDNIKVDFGKYDVGIWTGSNWLRIGTGGGHLWMW